MRKLWIIVISIAIVGGVALFEHWTALQFPIVDFEPTPLPELPIGQEWIYDYSVAGEVVGNYTYWVKSVGPYLHGEMGYFIGEVIYTVRSTTSAVRDGRSAELEALYVFTVELKPVDYRLNATLGGSLEQITCFFEKDKVLGRLETEGRVIEEPLDLPENSVLIDNLMVGHWDLLLKTFTPEPGKRIEIDVYVPQTLGFLDLEIIAEKNPRTITIGGDSLKARVIRVPELNLLLYLEGGDVIRMEETQQEITLTLRR
ncbi:MAG: hypothetical protein PVJ38_04885 [Candidatus Bathyarchaeota archaeon]|jgi:hypothetical protein